MVDRNNKIILILLSITLLITLVGTVVNLQRLSSSHFPVGAATASAGGNVTLTIVQQTSITNQHGNIQFGYGYVNASCTKCVMDSNGSIDRQCCGTFNWSNNLGFLLENTGGVNLSVNYTCAGSCTNDSLIGGTAPAFRIMATNNSDAAQAGEASTLDTEGSCNNEFFRGFNITNWTVEVSTAGHWLCGNGSVYPLDFSASRDAFVVDLNVTVPENAPAGTGFKSANFTFNALATG